MIFLASLRAFNKRGNSDAEKFHGSYFVNRKEKSMPKVEPSGVILHGVCDIQTDRCTAKDGGPSLPCVGRLGGHKSMCAGCVLKRRCAVASG